MDQQCDTVDLSDWTKDQINGKMKQLFSKLIIDVDAKVLSVSETQSDLDLQLDRLIKTLDEIKLNDKLTNHINVNFKRLYALKRRLTLIHTILSNSSSRCKRLLAANRSTVASLPQLTSGPSQ